MDVVELASQDTDREGNTRGVFSSQSSSGAPSDDDADLTLGK